MPTGDLDYGQVSWDPDRVRAAAQAVARRGDVLNTAATALGNG